MAQLSDYINRSALKRAGLRRHFPGTAETIDLLSEELVQADLTVDQDSSIWQGPVIDLGEGGHMISPLVTTFTQYDDGVGGNVGVYIRAASTLTVPDPADWPADSRLSGPIAIAQADDELPNVLEHWVFVPRYIVFFLSTETEFLGEDFALALSVSGVVR